MSRLSRRQFVLAGAGLCACAACPRLLAQAGRAPVDVGTPADCPADGIFDRYARQGFFLVRRENKLYALSSTCTHEPKPLTVARSRDAIRCAEHNSYFYLTGRVKSGKPKKPLPRFAIALNSQGRILVDLSKVIEDPNDPAGAVELK